MTNVNDFADYFKLLTQSEREIIEKQVELKLYDGLELDIRWPLPSGGWEIRNTTDNTIFCVGGEDLEEFLVNVAKVTDWDGVQLFIEGRDMAIDFLEQINALYWWDHFAEQILTKRIEGYQHHNKVARMPPTMNITSTRAINTESTMSMNTTSTLATQTGLITIGATQPTKKQTANFPPCEYPAGQPMQEPDADHVPDNEQFPQFDLYLIVEGQQRPPTIEELEQLYDAFVGEIRQHHRLSFKQILRA